MGSWNFKEHCLHSNILYPSILAYNLKSDPLQILHLIFLRSGSPFACPVKRCGDNRFHRTSVHQFIRRPDKKFPDAQSARAVVYPFGIPSF
jgi:hypothetical protein